MKLELKHIVPYLPYGLKCQLMGESKEDIDHDDNPAPKVFLIDGAKRDLIHVWSKKTMTDEWIYEEVFPILRPLSDLTKEIDIDGENVLFCDYITDKYGDCETFYSFNDGAIVEDTYRGEDAINHKHLYPNTECYPYFIIKELLRLHFDIFGLIKEGLAIDINTIN